MGLQVVLMIGRTRLTVPIYNNVDFICPKRR